MRFPCGRGDCWILEITHAPSAKNVFKNGFCPRKGVAFLWKAFLQKKIFRCGRRLRCRRLRSAAVTRFVPRRLRSRQPHSSLIVACSGSRHLVSVQKPFWGQRRRSGCDIDAAAIQRKAHMRKPTAPEPIAHSRPFALCRYNEFRSVPCRS